MLRPVDEDGNIELSIANFTASFGSNDLYYSRFYILYENGSLNVEISELSLYIKFKLTSQTLPDGATVPGIEVIESNLTIPNDCLNITIRGNNFMKVVSDISFAFYGVIRRSINMAVTKGIKALLPTVFDKTIAGLKGRSDVYEGLSIDW